MLCFLYIVMCFFICFVISVCLSFFRPSVLSPVSYVCMFFLISLCSFFWLVRYCVSSIFSFSLFRYVVRYCVIYVLSFVLSFAIYLSPVRAFRSFVLSFVNSFGIS